MCLFISCYCLSYHSLLVCFAWCHTVSNLFHGWYASCNIPNSSFACRPCFFFLILSIRPLASRIHIQPSQGGYPCPHHIHIQPPRGGYPCPHHALPIMFGLNCTFCIVTIPGQDELCMCQAFYVLLHLHLHACLVLFATKLHTIRIVKVVYTLEWWVGHLQQWRGPWQLRQYWHLGELGWWGAITMDSCERKEVVGFGYLN